VCFVGVAIVRIAFMAATTYMLLWVISYVDSGVVESDDQAKVIFINLKIVSIVSLFCV
jgi:hypothetical protein